MTDRPTRSGFRFPIFGKMISAFSLIILFMILASISVLYQLKETFSSAKNEMHAMHQSISLSQDLDVLLDDLEAAATEYIARRDKSSLNEYVARRTVLRNQLDSLHAIVGRREIAAFLPPVLRHEKSFLSVVETLASSGGSSDSLSMLVKLQRDSLRTSIRALTDANRHSISKAMTLFEQRAILSIDGAVVILLLSLVMALAIGFILTRTIVRPIHALKAGAERVADGHYEPVLITTGDEIADLTVSFNSMGDKLKKLDSMRTELMSEISHEMRSPLQIIKAACYAILNSDNKAPLTPRQIEAAGMITHAANRINTFVNSFLDVAKLEAGLMTFSFEPTDLNEFVVPLIQEAKLVGQTRRITVSLDSAPLPQISIDRQRMSQVITNLLSNALKYTPESGTITVSMRPVEIRNGTVAPAGIQLDVRDTGVGIPAQDLDKLFQKFYQAKNVPVMKEKGSGLGLALVKQVTEAHGGSVSVQSKPGEGSTFSLFLPASQHGKVKQSTPDHIETPNA